MLDHLVAAAALTLPATDREWAASRPSRGVHATAMRSAARIPARMQSFAQCVSARESGGSYSARNPRSSAQGRWQLLDTQWRVNGGVHYMVSKRMRAFGVPTGVRSVVRDYLHRTPIYRWPGPYQDMAFIQIMDEGGSFHWKLAGSKCEAYR